ncbi:MAG: TfoX/Sxy family protein [Marinicaulis sp.]|nr:TfoX/Sxy family protein [Marinicaulis sp.]
MNNTSAKAALTAENFRRSNNEDQTRFTGLPAISGKQIIEKFLNTREAKQYGYLMSAHLDYLKDLFSPFGEITIRKMFGGAGVYCDGTIFAICDSTDTDLWLKVDDVTRAEFEDAGLEPFTYTFDNGRTGKMSYYTAPQDIFDDADALEHWTQLALSAAARAKKPVKKKRTRKKKAVKKT